MTDTQASVASLLQQKARHRREGVTGSLRFRREDQDTGLTTTLGSGAP